MMSIKEKQQELIDDFAFLSDWEQKYEYIIDLGKELKGLPEEKKKEEVKEVYKDESYLKQSKEQSYITSIAQIGSGVFSFFIALITIIIFNFGVAIEFLNNANTGLDYAENIRKSKIRNLLAFTMSTVIGTLVFFNIYVLFRKYVSHANFNSSMLSLKEISFTFLYATSTLTNIALSILSSIIRFPSGFTTAKTAAIFISFAFFSPALIIFLRLLRGLEYLLPLQIFGRLHS